MEAMFIPMRLRDMLRDVKVAGAAGELVPLVTSERTVVTTTRPPEPARPPSHMLRYLLIGGIMALVIILAAMGGGGGLRTARVIAICWCVFAGLIGLLLVGLWTATDHVWAYSNTNLLLFNPLWFAVIPLVRRSRASGMAGTLIGLCAVFAACGLVLAVLGTPQASAQMAALAVPPIAATLWLARRRSLGPSRMPA
jgi:choline-glycine betaine transporter